MIWYRYALSTFTCKQQKLVLMLAVGSDNDQRYFLIPESHKKSYKGVSLINHLSTFTFECSLSLTSN